MQFCGDFSQSCITRDPSGSFFTQDFSLFLYIIMANTDKKKQETVLEVTRKSKLLFSYGLRTPVCITQVQQITKDKTRAQQQQQSLPRYPFLFTVTFSELLVYTNQRNQTNKEKETKELVPYVNKTCAWVASQIALYRNNNCTKFAPKSRLVYTCDF